MIDILEVKFDHISFLTPYYPYGVIFGVIYRKMHNDAEVESRTAKILQLYAKTRLTNIFSTKYPSLTYNC